MLVVDGLPRASGGVKPAVMRSTPRGADRRTPLTVKGLAFRGKQP